MEYNEAFIVCWYALVYNLARIPVEMLNNIHLMNTDIEPDDLMLIFLHAWFYPNVWVIYVIGESTPADKIVHLVKILTIVRPFNNYTVIQGLPSTKNFPSMPQTLIQPESHDVILERYRTLPKPRVVFHMKPMREELLIDVDRSGVHCFAYGSFNWRSLTKPGTKDEIDSEGINRMVARYARYNYYDTFHAIGLENSGLFETVPGSVIHAIVQLDIKGWNVYTIQGCMETINNITKIPPPLSDKNQGKLERNQQIVNNITPNVERQFVMADVLLLYTEMPTVPVRLMGFNDKGYPEWQPDESSNLFIHDVSEDQQRRRRTKLVEDLKKPHYELVNPITF